MQEHALQFSIQCYVKKRYVGAGITVCYTMLCCYKTVCRSMHYSLLYNVMLKNGMYELALQFVIQWYVKKRNVGAGITVFYTMLCYKTVCRSMHYSLLYNVMLLNGMQEHALQFAIQCYVIKRYVGVCITVFYTMLRYKTVCRSIHYSLLYNVLL